jgi:1-acyl-sn-glycerol-3-phosphate acyltransferase
MLLKKLRSAFVTAPLLTFATAVYGSVSLAVSPFSSTGRTQHRIAAAWAAMLLRIARVRVQVEGVEKIAPGGSYVFIANHRSYFDVPCIFPHVPVQFRFLANKNLFSVPFIGYHLSRAGHLPVNSENARESLKSMSEAARVIQERGISILLFPEGGRTYGQMDPFKDGAAYIAIKAGVPIVPIGLKGVRDVLPRGEATFRGGRVVMRIGDPIPTIDMTLQDRTALTQTLYQRVCELVDEPVAAAETVTAGRG